MRCISPRTVGFLADGKTLCWSPKNYSKEYATFQLPCGKCLECRLESARQTAVRCVHESKMYDDNSFITLTYDDQHLNSPKLHYPDFQNFMKSLRSKIYDEQLLKFFPGSNQRERRRLFRTLSIESQNLIKHNSSVGVFVAGEYGDRKKRPHWHAILFNWRPQDLKPKYVSERGDQVYTSDVLSSLWPHGASELGQVTFQSAGYVARYATKKLSHGKDGDHEYEPISKRSSRHAIGKKFLERYWQDIFTHGQVILSDEIRCGIPRYYEKWLQKNHPDAWKVYVTETKRNIIAQAIAKEEKNSLAEKLANRKRIGLRGLQIKKSKVRETIIKQKFDKLKQHQKL